MITVLQLLATNKKCMKTKKSDINFSRCALILWMVKNRVGSCLTESISAFLVKTLDF